MGASVGCVMGTPNPTCEGPNPSAPAKEGASMVITCVEYKGVLQRTGFDSLALRHGQVAQR